VTEQFQVAAIVSHRGVTEMKLVVSSICLLAVLFGSSALAFQEQKQGGAPSAGSPTSSAGPTDGAQPAAPLTDAGKGEGTVVSIPGLGNLGVLPKMDFGLELLYGATDSKANGVEREDGPPVDDLTIRGTVKHRF
jgi:hypothetical protein